MYRLNSVQLIVGLLVVLVPSLASAQAISGTVTDTTGGVLPGVTVEAESPATIERVRTAVTDGAGIYQIVALDPATYTVRYTLPGFTTLVREGVVLNTGFTANVDVQLSVGDIEETVTVSGASPVVDIQNVDQRQVMDREVIDSIPTGKSFQSYALLVPGMDGSAPFGTNLNQDSGGQVAQSYQAVAIHGGDFNDQVTAINGMDVSDASSRGRNYGLISDGDYQEMAIEYSAHSAEVETGGVRVNMIPREGANQFSGAFFGTWSTPGLQADNVDQDLRDRGVSGGGQVMDEAWLINPSVGGPIVRDRLWFFAGHTTQVANFFAPNTFLSQDPRALVYVPDLTSPAIDETTTHDQSLNLTWQATSKDKVKGFYSYAYFQKPHVLQGAVLGSLFVTPDAAVDNIVRLNTYQGVWVRPQTNRLLIEASFSVHRQHQDNRPTAEAVTSLPGVTEVPSLTMNRNATGWAQGSGYKSLRTTGSFRGSASYVTGSHNLKFGLAGVYIANDRNAHFSESDWTDVITLFGSPLFAQYRLPNISQNRGLSLGIYAQEQWTLDRLTVNAGVRFDQNRNSYPDQTRPGSIWAPVPFSVVGEEVTLWKDFQPRLGVAYDLLGDGKTALKVSASRYGSRENAFWAGRVNPILNNRIQRRLWFDGATCLDPAVCIPGDGIPQGDPLNPGPNGELLSPTNNPAFGKSTITTFFDQDWAFGWGNRHANWEFSGGLQHELTPGMSLDVSYFRRAYVNFSAQDNRAVAAGDFDSYTVSAPMDPRLPDGGGFPLTLRDINPAAFGRSPDNITTGANNFGGESRLFNGFDVTVDSRMEDLLLQGGLSTGTTSGDFCGLWSDLPEHVGSRADSLYDTDTIPQEYCSTKSNWLTQVKFLASYTLPYDVQIAGTFQSLPGPERQATLSVPQADIEAALGRPLAGGGSVSVNAIEPGTEFGERFNQFDLRFTKILSLGGTTRLRAMFDLFNVFNVNAVVKEQYGLGDNYLLPLGFMPGRLAKFSAQIDF